MPPPQEKQTIDLRMYVAMILLRWQVIAICFLYALLGGIVYIHLATPRYLTHCKIMSYRDPINVIGGGGQSWSSITMHDYLLQNVQLGRRVAEKLLPEWGDRMGGIDNMVLPIQLGRRYLQMQPISTESSDPAYGEAFLSDLLEEHRKEWTQIQEENTRAAIGMLEGDLTALEEKIRQAEDDVIEYQRLHDFARVEARRSVESRYLAALIERKGQLTTELMLLVATNPELKEENIGVLARTEKMTRDAAHVEPVPDTDNISARDEELVERLKGTGRPKLPSELAGDEPDEEETYGWRTIRVQLARLRQQEKQALANLEPEHPRIVAIRGEIKGLEDKLEVFAEIKRGNLKDRQRSLRILIAALEKAEYSWHAKYMDAAHKHAELKRKNNIVTRYEGNYGTLYSRLHDLKVSKELEVEHFHIVEPVETNSKPTWPDPLKIMLMVGGIGLASGIGLVVLFQIIENRLQTIKDVEQELGLPFLGGVPYWVRSGLEASVRPIVTEEHSVGAVEAYRVVRTSVLSALEKSNEKLAFLTSADSREGKTLTVLNLAIMIAQMGKRVLLVDMDLRRGRLHRSFGVSREPGVSNALREGGVLRDHVIRTRFENLDFVPTGTDVDEVAELLQSADINEFFSSVIDDYDYIFADTSPVLRVTDTVILTTHGVGVVVYVARVNRTPKPLIKYSLDMLKDGRVIGMIVNNIEMHRLSSLYYAYQYPNYAYYSNAYAYGYDYYYYDNRPGRPRRRGGRRGMKRARRRLAEWFKETFLPIE